MINILPTNRWLALNTLIDSQRHRFKIENRTKIPAMTGIAFLIQPFCISKNIHVYPKISMYEYMWKRYILFCPI